MVSSQSPEDCGGYTYEQEVLLSILNAIPQSHHQFHLLGFHREMPAYLRPFCLPWLSLYRSQLQRKCRRLKRLIGCFKGKSKPPLDYEIYRDLLENPIDFICYPTPRIRPIADIPYLTNVWDVEHRHLAFFTEISAHGEWNAREHRFTEMLQRAAYVITPNAHGKKELSHYYCISEERIRTLHQPTPLFALEAGTQPPLSRSLIHLGIKREFLLYPAGFWQHKNHFCLIEMLATIKARDGSCPQLVLTGGDKGNYTHVLSLIHAAGLTNDVMLTGFVERNDLIALYQQAIALVYPSYFGPENLPPLEAFALGCPVIASDLPGPRVQLEGAALLADPTNAQAWVDAYYQLRTQPELRQYLIDEGKRRAEKHSGVNFAKGLFSIFDEFERYRKCWPSS